MLLILINTKYNHTLLTPNQSDYIYKWRRTNHAPRLFDFNSDYHISSSYCQSPSYLPFNIYQTKVILYYIEQ